MLGLKTKFSLTNFGLHVLALPLFFPWVSFQLTSFGVQPWVVLAAGLMCILLVARDPSIPVWTIVFLALPPIVVASYLVASTPVDFMFFRSIFGFTGFFLYIVAGVLWERRYGIAMNFLRALSVVWIVAGIVQQLFGKDVLTLLLDNRTSAARGVTSLAPEPTFFGFALFFLSWIIIAKAERRGGLNGVDYIIVAANFIAILALARSATVFVVIIAVLLILALTSGLRNAGYAFLLSIFGGVIFLGFINIAPDTRIARLTINFSENFTQTLVQDRSVNQRLQGLLMPLYLSVMNYGVPQSPAVYAEQRKEIEQRYEDVIDPVREERGTYINSGTAAIIYQLGFASLLWVSGLWYGLRQAHGRIQSLRVVVLWHVAFAPALSIALPFPFLVLAVYLAGRDRQD